MRRPVLRLASVVFLLAAVVVAVGGPVSADAPTKQGWWSTWQQADPSAGSGLPVGPPVPVTVPPPPTSEGGLTVARSPEQPEAVAAVYIEVPLGADGVLTLRNAGGHELALPPDAQVSVCTATTEWEEQFNGRSEDAPMWSENCVIGALAEDKKGLVWEVPWLLQNDDGAYDLVIVPTAGQAPFTISFAKADEETFAVGEAPPPPPSTTTTTTTLPPENEPEPEVVTTTTIEVPGGIGGFPPVTAPPPPPRRTTPTSLVALDAPRQPTPFAFPDSRGERIMAVSLLFFMAVSLWWLGGSPTRGPRLLGAVAGRHLDAAAPRRGPVRGLGRFARERLGRPPRL